MCVCVSVFIVSCSIDSGVLCAHIHTCAVCLKSYATSTQLAYTCPSPRMCHAFSTVQYLCCDKQMLVYI